MTKAKEFQHIAQSFTILFVDDDANIRRSMEQYLSKFFQSVAIASDGEEGLEVYKKEQYDIVLTDISMPSMNGIEMSSAIKKLNKNQEIIIATAFSEFSFIKEAITLGVSGYLLKPLDNVLLLDELNKVVMRLHIKRENEAYKNRLEEMVEEQTINLKSLQKQKIENYNQTLYSMVEMIEKRDTYTAGHTQRVANYSILIAEKMEYPQEEKELLYQAGMLHDLGKIATPDAVLLNPRKLNGIEYKLIQEHASVGYDLLKKVPMFQEVAEIVGAHHEKYDGSGYPRGIKNEEIPELARILSVADTFDAMTTNRIYKSAKTKEEALKEIGLLEAKHFDPQVVEAALIALKDIEIDTKTTQVPQTEIEKERFAYFFKDNLLTLYNQNYFELMLQKNIESKEYIYLYVVSLQNFSLYNQKHGWSSGDKLLTQITEGLHKVFSSYQISRIFGDDFVFLSKQKVDFTQYRSQFKFLQEFNVKIEFKEFNLKELSIGSCSDLQKLL